MSLIAGRGCRWPPRRDSVSPCAPLSGGGRDTHDGHENSPILVFFSNLLEQAFDFFEAAQNPNISSKPLLFYYSFLNLAKVTLLIQGIPLPAKLSHGISEVEINRNTRTQTRHHKVRVPGIAHNHSQLFPEFLKILGGNASSHPEVRIIHLLAQIPAIHRTYVTVTRRSPNFLPVHHVRVLTERGRVWARFALRRGDRDVQIVLPRLKADSDFSPILTQVRATDPEEYWFETDDVRGARRGMDRGIARLAASIRRLGLATILTRQGYKLYLHQADDYEPMPQLAAIYALFFYLGSITRYHPHLFDRIFDGGYAWLVGEFVSTCPKQFVFTLASELAEVDVVMPGALLP